MFDVSFTELMVIGIVALVVIGPERLPRVARTVGHLLGRLQRYVNNVKSDINREMHLEDLKRFEERVRSEAVQVQRSVNQELVGIQASVENTPVATDAQAIATPSQPQPVDSSAVSQPLSFDADKATPAKHV